MYRDNHGVSKIIGVVILVVFVIVLSVGVLFTAQTLIGDQQQEMTAGTTDERADFYTQEAQLVNQGNTDTVYAISPLGTEYKLEDTGELQKILPIKKDSHPDVSQYQIMGEKEGQRQLLKTTHFEEGVNPDIIVHDDGDKDYESIQTAINNIDDDTERDISSSDPGVIVVQKGVYNENIDVSDNINLIAEYGTIIQDSNPNEDVVTIRGDNVRFQNFEVDGDPTNEDGHYARHGVNVKGSDAVVQGNTIYRAQSPDVESGALNIDGENTVVRYNNMKDSSNSITLKENSFGPVICGNQFENKIGGYASLGTQKDIAKLNHWNGGVPSNLARAILTEEAKGDSKTDYTLPENVPKKLLQSTDSRIPSKKLGKKVGRAGLPFPGTRLVSLSETEISDCEISINIMNTGSQSVSIEEIEVKINGRKTTIEVVKEVNLGVKEEADTRDVQAVCTGCEDGTYDPGDSISIPEKDWDNIYTYTMDSDIEPLPFTSNPASDPEPDSFSISSSGGTVVETTTSADPPHQTTEKEPEEDKEEKEYFRILLGSSVDINLADEVIIDPVVSGAEGEIEYDWSLGDGSTSTEQKIQHFYEDPGTYTVELTVTDSATGETDTDSTTVTVEEGKKDVEQIRADEQDRLADLVQEDPDGDGKILYLEEDVTYDTLSTINAKDLTIIGQGEDRVTLEGPITVTSSDVTLKNVRITKGLIVQNSGFKLYNSKVTSTEGFAVEVDSNGQDFYIGKSTVDGWNGIYSNVDGGFTIGNTDISARDEYGFYVDRGVSGVNVRDSTIESPEVGIYESLGSNVDVENTQISAPTDIYFPEPQAPVINDMNAEFSVAEIPIQFSNDVYDPDGFAIEEVTWEMGDGTTYTRKPNNSPLHTYDEAGKYDVTMIVKDQFGETTTKTMSMDIDPLEFNVISPERASDGDVITFTPEFNVPDHRVHSVTYDWGDGTSEELSPESRTHKYDSTGTYEIDATLKTDTGVTRSAQTTVEVVSSPVADFNIESIPLAGKPTSFNGEYSTSPDGEGLDYLWEMGDGTTYTSESPQHTFDSIGEYDVSLTVTDNEGFTDKKTVRIPITNFNVDASLVDSAGAERPTEFTVDTSISSSQISYYIVDFGDGSKTKKFSNEPFTYQYDSIGEYDVIIDTYSNSEWSRDKMSVEVTEPPQIGTPKSNRDNPSADTPVEFTIEGPYEYNYKWNFDDGETATGRINEHTFTKAGTYDVTVTATNSDGVTTQKSITIEVSKFTADFTISEETPSISDTINFDASASTADPTETTYTWMFGDQSSQKIGQQVSHSYDTSGEYTVTLTIEDQYGATNTHQKNILVSEPGTSDYTEKFEDSGLDGWLTNTNFNQVTNPTFNGNGAAGINEEDLKENRVAVASPYDGDGKPTKFTFRWKEDRGSNSGGLMLENSDGNYEAGFFTDNPQWGVYDANGDNRIYSGSGYGQWVEVEYIFDWDSGTFKYKVTDLNSGHTETGTGTLAHGKGVNNIVITNPSGDIHYWVDDIELQGDPIANAESTITTAVEGQEISFDGKWSSGIEATYEWDFNDGNTATGKEATHVFTEPGTYDVRYDVTDKYGNVDSDFITIKVKEITKKYFEGFESNTTDKWVKNTETTFKATDDKAYDGTYSGRIWDGNAPGETVIASNVVYPGGDHPDKFVYYYNEPSNSNSAGIKLENTNGQTEVGFHTNNPEWYLESASGNEYLDNNADYGDWVRVEFNFHWDEGTFAYYIEDLSNGEVREGQKELRQGIDIEDIHIEGFTGGTWDSGSDTHMKFDKIQLQDRHEATYEVMKTTLRVNEQLAFDGSHSVGTDETYEWDFDDGSSTTGTQVTHSYSSTGKYDVTLTVREGDGSIETFTRTITVEGGQFSEDFEDGLTEWRVYDSQFEIETDRVYTGSQSVGDDTSNMNQQIASTYLYPDGKQIKNFEYYYSETSNSNGGGIRFINSNGQYEMGTATDNPGWDISDALGIREIDSGDGYEDWVKVQITFDWEHNEYRYRFENLATGKIVEGVSELRQGIDISKIQIENYNGEKWESGDFNMRFDDLSEEYKETQAYPYVPESANKGETISFTDGTSTIGTSEATYEWDFDGDGITDATGKEVTHLYNEIGDYDVTLTITDDNGNIDSKTQTIPIRSYTESFEDGLNDWMVNNDNFQQTPTPHLESYSAGLTDENVDSVIAENTLYENGKQPNKLVYRYYENKSSAGGGLRVKNSNGRYELGTATDNPEWDVSGGGGTEEVNNEGSYQNWIRVEINFDWANNEYDYKYTNLDNEKTYSGTKAMRHGKDMSKITIEEYNGGSWNSGNSIYMWFDNIYVSDE